MKVGGLKVKVVDQREIQRIGGRASAYPSSYIVVKMLAKHGLFSRVLDVTYGRGRFYYYRRPRFLVGADPKVWEWVVAPDIFIPKPVWALKHVLCNLNLEFDVIVCDPPAWNPSTSYNRRAEYSFIIGSSRLIIEKTVELARELGINYMLLHFNKTIELPIVENIKFRYVARYLNNPNLQATTLFTLYKIG